MTTIVIQPRVTQVTLQSPQIRVGLGVGQVSTQGQAPLSKVAVQALGGHRVVVGVGDAQCDYADPTVLGHAGRVLGLTQGAIAAGSPVVIVSEGEVVDPGWSWVPDEGVWLGANALLTQTPPYGGAFSQMLGYAMSPTRVFLELSEPILF